MKPSIATFSPRRLTDTKAAAIFLESVNVHIWENNIQDKPILYALDVANVFPSVTEDLALPAIAAALKTNGLKKKEITSVIEGCKVLRSGSFFKWKNDYWSQISGCALGDVDSCSYTDIAMAHLLSTMIPAAENALSTSLDWFKIYRDDGLGITFDNADKVLSILEFFNNFSQLKWTIPQCSICNIPELSCPHYDHLDFLDTRITWRQVRKENIMVWQFTMSAFSKPTDAHAYLSPSSCTAPHLNEEGISVAKTVGARLRSIHSSDQDLLNSLNLYSGYLVARGYQDTSIKFHLASMANRDRMSMLSGQFKPKPKLTVPLVINLHPAITCLSTMVSTHLSVACKADPILNVLIPPKSLVVAYRKLPNLMRLLCSPDQNKFISPPSPPVTGYVNTGCRCMVCKASNFGRFVISPSLPGYKIPIPATLTCSSGPAVVYHLVCRSGRPECRQAHYVGMASTSKANQKPMASRWANHKAHHKAGRNLCQMTEHLITFHKHEDAQSLVKLTLLDVCSNQEEAKLKETQWSYKLFSFYPAGLNIREEIKF